MNSKVVLLPGIEAMRLSVLANSKKSRHDAQQQKRENSEQKK